MSEEKDDLDLTGLTDEEADLIREDADEAAELEAEKEAEIKAKTGEDSGNEEGEKEEEKDESVVDVQKPTPLLSGELPEEHESKLSKIAEDKKALVTEFDDGDITASEYQDKLDELYREERKLEQDVFKSNIAKEMEENQQRQQWMNTVNGFLDQHKEYRESEVKYNMLDMLVKQIANNSDNASMTGIDILTAAHTKLTEEFGQTAAKPSGNGKNGKPAIPPTLATVPASEMQETGNSKFKAMDRLADIDPLRYESLMADMDEDEWDRYANDAGA